MLYMYVYISYDVTSFNTYLMHIETQNCYVCIYMCVYMRMKTIFIMCKDVHTCIYICVYIYTHIHM